MRGAPRTSRSLLASRLRTAAAVFSLASLAACANWPAQNDTPDTGELLRNSLPVAAAALAAGQFNLARRLYLSLSERFDSNAPGGPNPAFAAAREALAGLCATPPGPPAAAYGGTSNAYRRWVEDQVRELPEPSETAASAAGGS